MAAAFHKKAVHGSHQEWHWGKFRTNKYGVLSGTIQRHLTEVEEITDWRLVFPAAALTIGIPCVGAERTYDTAAGQAIYEYTYDGVTSEGSGIEDKIYCTLEGTDSEEPIETHPQFAELFRKYKGKNKPGTQIFDYFSKKLGTGGDDDINPLYGVTHFLTLGMIWTYTCVVGALPVGLTSRVDTISQPLGHGAMQPPILKGRRNWLEMAPAAQQRSNYITLSRRWMASGRNGWNADIYTEKSGAGA